MLRPYRRAEIAFDLIREIGQQGRNSEAHLARDPQLDADIVIKIVAKARLNSAAEFFNEAKALYASAHPNVVQVLYACEDADSIYLAMPFYQRGSLTSSITDRFMSVREMVSVSCQILSGLHNIHSKRLVHFDIKPDNVLLSERGEALVSDFGLAKQMNYAGIAPQDRHYTSMMPPEATRTDHFDVTFDIYQFGLTLYRMCHGNAEWYRQVQTYGSGASFDRIAFRNDIRNERFPDRSFPPHIPERLRKVVKKCLKADPSDRFGTALDCANALAQIDTTHLDWRMNTINSGRRWTKNEGGTYYDLTVDSAGASACTKRAGTGQPRRVTHMCTASIAESELKKFFGAY